ncbi:MAG: 5-(carboxyamino)imidazole ribonucleotide synthase [Chitinispirillales bacterium]|jgi:5-(carboxyamino)imidazole ribonucleotide synthase|nr:5-(carboxyamino)imidazole ribonucleotide synthase [Chitinispirillales bacterium]
MKIGILGGGQLARMLALGGIPIGAKFVVLDPTEEACAAAVCEHIIGFYGDTSILEQFADKVDVITYEFENVPPKCANYLSAKKPVYPPPAALEVSCDRLREKTLFRELGIDTPNFAVIGSFEELTSALREIGLPSVLKTRTLGYDGKGQTVLHNEDDVKSAWARLGGVDCILEAFVPFTREISIIAVRSRTGEIIHYPVGENTHRHGILQKSVCCPSDPMQSCAEEYSRKLLERLDYVGVLALELFEVNGKLLANEIAPRVHNTGHWSIEGAGTSQFENHIRAITGLPLGDPSPVEFCAMVNFIGKMPDASSVLSIEGAHFHDYGKVTKPGRKLGHATIRRPNKEAALEGFEKLLALAN